MQEYSKSMAYLMTGVYVEKNIEYAKIKSDKGKRLPKGGRSHKKISKGGKNNV